MRYINSFFAKLAMLAMVISFIYPAVAMAQEGGEEAKQQIAGNILPYKYTSSRYGYTIFCPQKPIGIMPASMISEGDKGDVLIFEAEGSQIKKAWIICVNAYPDGVIPANIASLSTEEREGLIKEFGQNYGFEQVNILELENGNEEAKYGLLGLTAKKVEIDTDGDGVFDTVAIAENQMAKAFMTGEYGGHFVLGLIENPDMTEVGLSYFYAGISTFQQWPTSAYEKARTEAAKNEKKKA